MYKYATSIGIDIGRTRVRTAIVQYGGDIIYEAGVPYDGIPDRDKLISVIIRAINNIRVAASEHKVNPMCIGIAAKGFINYREGVIYGPDQGIDGWENVELSKILNRKTGLPVFIDNDANLMAFAEHLYGSGRGFDNIIFVALRSGIGGAIIIDGKLYRGTNNAGGEIGQMSIDLFGQYSDKGIRGSFEYFASSVALVRNYLVMSGQNINDSNKENNQLTARDVFDLSYKGDHYARLAVKDNANYVGAGLANIISIFSPDLIILGGGMAMAKDEYLKMIEQSAEANSLPYCRRDTKIARAKLGLNASLQGAGIYALTRLDGKNI